MRRDLSRPGVRGGVMGWRGRREPMHGGSHAASMPRDAPPSHHPSTDPWRRSRHRDARAEQAGIDCVTGDSGPRQNAHRPSTAAVASRSLFETGELGDGASRGMDAACEPPGTGLQRPRRRVPRSRTATMARTDQRRTAANRISQAKASRNGIGTPGPAMSRARPRSPRVLRAAPPRRSPACLRA